MLNMWEELEEEISKMTNQYVVIDLSEQDYWKVFIDHSCVRVNHKFYEQYRDTKKYITDEIKKELPEYFL